MKCESARRATRTRPASLAASVWRQCLSLEPVLASQNPADAAEDMLLIAGVHPQFVTVAEGGVEHTALTVRFRPGKGQITGLPCERETVRGIPIEGQERRDGGAIVVGESIDFVETRYLGATCATAG